MDAREQLAEAARELRPMRQGQLDGLCGLYSVINAVRLALYPGHRLRKPELGILFAAGLKALNRSRRLTAVVRDGMSEEVWLTLCDAVLFEANVLLGAELRRAKLVARSERPDTRHVLSLIRGSLRAGCPVLMSVTNAVHHATVVASYSDTRIGLFDSAGSHWISLTAIGLDHTRTTKRHRLSVASASRLIDLVRITQPSG